MGLYDKAIARKIIRKAQSEFAGIDEVTAFFEFMSGKEKNPAIKRVNKFATKSYRTRLKAITPINRDPSLIMSKNGLKRRTRKKLKETIDVISSSYNRGSIIKCNPRKKDYKDALSKYNELITNKSAIN